MPADERNVRPPLFAFFADIRPLFAEVTAELLEDLRLFVVSHPAAGLDRLTSVCEHVFVTSQGSPYARFRHAIGRGQPTKALAAAAELAQVSLSDALDLCLLLATAGDEHYEAAARRWLQRFAAETPTSVNEVVMAGAALAELGRRPSSEIARDTLEQLLAGPPASPLTYWTPIDWSTCSLL